jgi:4-hydroxy-3-methylbut-2-enyl diphosphate reductase
MLREMTRLLILAPLAIEARALRRGVSRHRPGPVEADYRAEVARTGMGPKASARAAARLAVIAGDNTFVVVAGFCGGLRPEIHTGDVIVGTEIRGPSGVVELPAAGGLAETLRSAGLTVHAGPLLSSAHLAFGAGRSQMASGGALGVDMESYWLLCERSQQAAVVRAVSDTAGERLLGGMLPLGWLRAYRSLVRASAALAAWAPPPGDLAISAR